VDWVKRMTRWMTRHVRASLADAPTPPSPERIARARQAAETSDRVLNEVRSRDPEIMKRANRSERLLRDNNLGPAFMKNLGDRRT
jgi:hypothetical protein